MATGATWTLTGMRGRGWVLVHLRHPAAPAPLEIQPPLWMGRDNTLPFHESAECSLSLLWVWGLPVPRVPSPWLCSGSIPVPLLARQGTTLPLQVRQEQRALTAADSLRVKRMETFHALAFRSQS